MTERLFKVREIMRANFRKAIDSPAITARMEILRLEPISGGGQELRAIAAVGGVKRRDKVRVVGKHPKYPSYWKVEVVERARG